MTKQVNHSQINIYDFFFADKRRKTYTNLGISLILIIILLIFALRPTILTIGKIKDKIKQYDEVNGKVEGKIDAAQKLSQQMSRSSSDYQYGLSEEIDFLDQTFFDEPDVKTLYKNIYERASKSNIAIKSMTPKYVYMNNNSNTQNNEYDQTPQSPSTKYYEMSISFEAKKLSDIENFFNTLESYEKNPIVSRVKSANINNHIEENKVKNANGSLQNSSDQNIISGNIVMVLYLDDTRLVTPTEVAG